MAGQPVSTASADAAEVPEADTTALDVATPTTEAAPEPEPASQPARQPIVWTGRAKEPAGEASPVAKAALEAKPQQQEARPQQRLKPNTAFLLNVVADAERGNQRRCAEEATNVSLSVLEKLARTADAGDGNGAALRRAVLSIAQQQRLAACSALLTEVALHYGFALHIAPDVGDEDAGSDVTLAPAAAEASGGAAAAQQPAAAEERPGWRLLQPLQVALDLTSRRARPVAELAEMDAPADAYASAAAPRSPAPKAPVLNATATRLAGAAFGAIGAAAALPRPKPARPARVAGQKVQAPLAEDEDLRGEEGDEDWGNGGGEEEEEEEEELEWEEQDSEAEEAVTSSAAQPADPGHLLSNGWLRQPQAGAKAGAKGKAAAAAALPTRGLRMDDGADTPLDDAGEGSLELEGGAGGSADEEATARPARKQAAGRKLRADGPPQAVAQPAAKRVRMGSAASGAHIKLAVPDGAAVPARRQGSAPQQPGAAMAHLLSQAAAAAHRAPSAAVPAPALNGAVPSRKGAAGKAARGGSSIAERLGKAHLPDALKTGEQAVALSKGRAARKRSGGGLFGAAMAGVEGRLR